MFRIVWIVWDGHRMILSNHPQEDDRFFLIEMKKMLSIFFLRMGVWKFFSSQLSKKKNIFLSIAVPIFFTYIDICRWVVRAVSIDYEPSSKRRLFQIEIDYDSNRTWFAWKILFFLTDVGKKIFPRKLRFRLLREATPVSTYSVLALEVESYFYLPYIFPVYMRVCARKTKNVQDSVSTPHDVSNAHTSSSRIRLSYFSSTKLRVSGLVVLTFWVRKNLFLKTATSRMTGSTFLQNKKN